VIGTDEGGSEAQAAHADRQPTLPPTDDLRPTDFRRASRGWIPKDANVDARVVAVMDRRRHERRPAPLKLEGAVVPCCICGPDAEPSTVGTPTCSEGCLGQLADRVLPLIAARLRERPSEQVAPPRPHRRPALTSSPGSVERALLALGSCADVLSRHGHDVRRGRALCPLHTEHTPSLVVREHQGKSRWHCFGCEEHGDALDLEAALMGELLSETIRRWGR